MSSRASSSRVPSSRAPLPSTSKLPPGADGDERGLFLFETTLASKFVPSADNPLPSLRSYHSEDVKARVNNLKYISCQYLDHPNFRGYWFVVNARHDVIDPPIGPSNKYASAQWLSDEEPWLGFTPSFGANQGTYLSPLCIPNHALPYATTLDFKNDYILHPDISRTWRSLEIDLLAIARTLAEHLPHLPPLKPPSKPSEFKYSDAYTSRLDAIEAIRKSRNAFSRLITFISFCFSFWNFCNHVHPLNPMIKWFDVNKPHWSAAIHQLARSSTAGDFRIRKPDGLLHRPDRTNLPMGADPSATEAAYQVSNPEFARVVASWRPWTGRLSAAYGDFLAQLLKQPAPPSFTTVSLGGEEAIVPALACHGFIQGDYVPGTSPADYFAMKREMRIRWENGHTLSKEAREFAMRPGESATWQPYFSAYSVFVWECERGAWSRRPVDASTKKALFEAFPFAQRYWCPINEEFELCEYLQPGAGSADLISTTDDGTPLNLEPRPQLSISSWDSFFSPASPDPDTSDVSLPSPHGESSLSIAPSPPRATIDPDSESDYGNEDPPRPGPPSSSVHPPSSTSTVLDSPPEIGSIISARLGYDLVRSSSPNVSPFFPEGSVESRSLQCLGYPGSAKASKKDLRSIVDAVAEIGQGKVPLRDLSARWDLAAVATRPSLPLNLQSWQISYTQANGEVAKRYVIGIKDKIVEEQYFVLVVSGPTLYQVSREGLPGVLAIGRYMISRGLPFSTAIARSMKHQPRRRPVARPTIGEYPWGTTMPAESYKQYEQMHDAFLATRRGALALKAGGLLWRFAIDKATKSQRDAALKPPSAVALDHGAWMGSMRSLDVVSDCLEEHEIDLILGAYRTRPTDGRVVHKESITFLWPPPSAWAKSGLNVGEWSPAAEAWFQERQSHLRSGKGVPNSIRNWKPTIRRLAAVPKFWAAYEKLADEAYSS
ncbi:hypothetical protein CC1G_13169 [Coprinopsis cinerea okayama7|uniref:Uncharacterized protein n=1 Tax=Coprinopsis cinerea (strain Okayama-7 / 130 / ATCC MYA-4618 / FGSC 9003) TaxID=240176 RepID=A8P782_COPC7|nr:hypothetical protein CC1G_13169 [Coprinopsis cinerea okayama7\|eukprot:XP_001839312.2 hypothetical protein CC1G_13169 [Coprinopsis cinerea okayama7\